MTENNFLFNMHIFIIRSSYFGLPEST